MISLAWRAGAFDVFAADAADRERLAVDLVLGAFALYQQRGEHGDVGDAQRARFDGLDFDGGELRRDGGHAQGDGAGIALACLDAGAGEQDAQCDHGGVVAAQSVAVATVGDFGRIDQGQTALLGEAIQYECERAGRDVVAAWACIGCALGECGMRGACEQQAQHDEQRTMAARKG